MRAALLGIALVACGGNPIDGTIRDPDPMDPSDPMDPMDPMDPVLPVVEVELDAMNGRAFSDAVLEAVQAAYRDVQIDLRFTRDEQNIPPLELDGTFEQRRALLSQHRDDPTKIHVFIASRRSDLPGRGGELVTADALDQAGVLIYRDTLEALHPACARAGIPAIERDEAFASTLTHELGHSLQLGHDTDAGGGINYFNVMSEPASCEEAQQRFHGLGNDDPTLGATEEISASRFSAAAKSKIDLTRRVSVDVSTLDGDVGHEM